RRFLLDAARRLRETARTFRAVRPSFPHFLPPPRLSRSALGDDAAAGAQSDAAAAASRCDPRSGGAFFRSRRQAQETAGNRAGYADDRFGPRSPAAKRFRADDQRR